MSTNPSTLADRDIRQRALVPQARLQSCHAIVVGVGAIGRQVALQLAALGVSQLTLIDHDTVNVENLAPQGYWPEDLGQAKVHATARLCLRIHPSATITTFAERFRRSSVNQYLKPGDNVVVACVDRIGTRRNLWESLGHRCDLFLDGRMNGEVVRVLSATGTNDSDYATTLFPAPEAHVGPCTARSTIYTASIAAGLMIHQFARWLRNLSVENDVTLNLLAMELAVGNEPARSRLGYRSMEVPCLAV